MYQSLQSFDHLKEESRWQWVMKKEMRRESETPHNMHSTASSRATNQVTLKKEEKRRPQYLATTASMRAMTLPTRKYVKRESRLPPRMVLRKHEAVSSVLVEGKERKGAVPAAPEQTVVVSQNPALTEATAVEEKPVNSSLEGSTSGTQKSSISTSPDRTTLLPAKKEEGNAGNQFGVSFRSDEIEASPCVAIKKASTNPPTKVITFVTCRRGGDASTSSDEELDRELLALSYKDNPCPCERE